LREAGLLFAGTGDTGATGWQPVMTEANGIKVGLAGDDAVAEWESQSG